MTHVRDLMEAHPQCAEVPGRRRDVLALFKANDRAAFAVLKASSRKLVGVIHRSALLENPEETQAALLMDPNPATTYPQAPTHEAATLLVTHRLQILPVVTGANDLAGVLTPLRLLPALKPPKSLLGVHLRRRLVPAHVGTPARVALEILRATRARALPVLGDDGTYAGLLTDADLLRASTLEDSVVYSMAGLARDGDPWKWETIGDAHRVGHNVHRLEAPDASLAQLMDARLPTLGPETTLREAVERMLASGRSMLPVVDANRRILDVVSDLDLLTAALPTVDGRRL